MSKINVSNLNFNYESCRKVFCGEQFSRRADSLTDVNLILIKFSNECIEFNTLISYSSFFLKFSTMTELLLDPNIRLWVFLPIVIITFLVGIVRHYISIILSSQKKIELLQVQDRYVLLPMK